MSFLRKAFGTSGNAVRGRNARKAGPKENAMVQKRSGTFPFLGKALLRFLLSCLVFFTPSPERILPGEKGTQLCSLWGRDVPGAVWFPLQRFPALACGGASARPQTAPSGVRPAAPPKSERFPAGGKALLPFYTYFRRFPAGFFTPAGLLFL